MTSAGAQFTRLDGSPTDDYYVSAERLKSYERAAIRALGDAKTNLQEALGYIQLIHDQRIYPGVWAEYVKATFGVSRQHIERLVKHAETLGILRSTIGAVLDELPEGVTRPISRVDADLRPLVYKIAMDVAGTQGVNLNATITGAAAETVQRMVETGNLNADESAHEYRLSNIERHAKWTPVHTLHNPDRTQIDDLKTYVSAQRADHLTIKIVVYIEKDAVTQ